MCLSMVMLICIKQYFSNIWSSIHEKVKQHWGWVKKKAYKNTLLWLCGKFSFRRLSISEVSFQKCMEIADLEICKIPAVVFSKNIVLWTAIFLQATSASGVFPVVFPGLFRNFQKSFSVEHLFSGCLQYFWFLNLPIWRANVVTVFYFKTFT